jgi:hypothetical protein
MIVAAITAISSSMQHVICIPSSTSYRPPVLASLLVWLYMQCTCKGYCKIERHIAFCRPSLSAAQMESVFYIDTACVLATSARCSNGVVVARLRVIPEIARSIPAAYTQ